MSRLCRVVSASFVHHLSSLVTIGLLSIPIIVFRKHGIWYYNFCTVVTNQAAVRLYEKLGMSPLHLSFIGET
jgi:hypothetical protein